MTTEIIRFEQHGFISGIMSDTGKFQFISQAGFGIWGSVQMNIADTAEQFICSRKIKIFTISKRRYPGFQR